MIEVCSARRGAGRWSSNVRVHFDTRVGDRRAVFV